MSSSALISSSGDCGPTPRSFHGHSSHHGSHAGSRGSHGGRSSHGSHGSGRRGTSSMSRGDRKCTYCGSLGHFEPWCWKKYGKPDYVNQVMDAPSLPSTSFPSDMVVSPVDSRDTLTIQISEVTDHVHSLHIALPSSSITTLASTGNIARMAQTSKPWLLDSGASSNISDNSSLFNTLHPCYQ